MPSSVAINTPQAPTTPVVEPSPRLLLHGIRWETYESLLADLGDSNAFRLTFDQGALQVMSPTAEHEEYNRTLALLVEVVAEELSISIRGLGSTTFKRSDLLKGFEPDSCFYIQSARRIKGKRRLDLSQDPPPDLVIEIDLTSLSLDRFPLFAQVGVPEVWRYDGTSLQMFRRVGNRYEEVTHSVALPVLTSTAVLRFLEESLEVERLEWLRGLREWVRQRRAEDESPR